MAAVAFAIVVSISIALTLSVEGAGYLFMRQQIRTVLGRTRRAAIQAQQETVAEDERVVVVR